MSHKTPAQKMTSYLRAVEKADGFSGAVLVARDQDTVFEQGVGFANIENGASVAPTTIFRIGSLTKPITAAAVFLLHGEGFLSINDRVCQYVPDCPASWSAITIRHLLTHSSGIPNVTSLPDYPEFMQVPTTPRATLARVMGSPLEFHAGGKFAYSNSGYILLGMLIEQFTDGSYAKLLKAYIFDRLQMHDTGDEVPAALMPRLARGYELDGDEPMPARRIHMSIPNAAGALYSTVGDLRRFASGLFRTELISASSMKSLLTPDGGRYACGWFIDRHHLHPVIWHSGGINGFSSHMAYYPDDRVTVVVLSNRENGNVDRTARDLASIALNRPYTPPIRGVNAAISAKDLCRYTGVYEVKPGVLLTVTVENALLYVQVTGQEKFAAYPISAIRFLLRAVDAEITFKLRNSNVHGLEVRQHHHNYLALRIQ